MIIQAPYSRFVRYPDGAAAANAWHELHALVDTLPVGTYTILRHHLYGDSPWIEVVGETPSRSLERAFRRVFAAGQVVRPSAEQRRYLLVEHVKTQRDNGWLPIGKNVDVTALYDSDAPCVEVTPRVA